VAAVKEEDQPALGVMGDIGVVVATLGQEVLEAVVARVGPDLVEVRAMVAVEAYREAAKALEVVAAAETDKEAEVGGDLAEV